MTDWSILERIWTTLVTRVSTFIPNFLAAALVLILGWLISRMISALALKFLKRIRVDSWLGEKDLSYELEPGQPVPSPTRVISRLVFWILFLSFVVIAMEQLGLDLSVLPVQTFIAYLPVVLGAVFLLMAGVLVASFLARGAESALRGMGVDHPKRIGKVVKGLVIALTAIIVVEQLGFDVAALTQTFSNLVVVVAAGLVLVFAWGAREVARNVLAGYYVREHFQPGDRIGVDGFEGELISVGSLNSRLDLDKGEVVVPNSRLIEQTVARVGAK